MNTVNWILVPIDYSEESKLALEAADAEALHFGGGLVLLHVHSTSVRPRTHLTVGNDTLGKWTQYIRHTPKNQIAYVMCAGDPAKEILRIARQYRVRKIIMGRGGNELQPGSVARRVGTEFPGVVEVMSKSHDDVFVRAGA